MDKVKKLSEYWFILLFAASLIMPFCVCPLDSKAKLNGVSAEPQKVEASKITLGDGSFQSYLNNLWEAHFPGRNVILRVRNQVLYSMCKVSPNSNVVIGKDDYLYEPQYILFEDQIYAPSTQEYFTALGDNLSKLRNILEENGKELYIFVTPSKAHFCSENIPGSFKILSQKGKYEYTNYSKLIETLDNNNILYFDSVKYIEENGDQLEAPLFYATGIHWSQPWGKTCAAEFLNYINEHSKYDLSTVSVKEVRCDKPVYPATDLYASLNLATRAKGEWWDSSMMVEREGSDRPRLFMRGGSFMGQSLNALVQSGVFGDTVHFENNYYFLKQYTEQHTISSFTAYDEIDLNQFLGQSDILVLEVNECAIYTMSWGFVDYVLQHPEIIDYDTSTGTSDSNEIWGQFEIKINDAIPTEENPWGYTAGLVDVDEYGKSVLLYPNTSFTVLGLEGDECIPLKVQIHPWVRGATDGAGIIIWFMDDTGNIVEEQQFFIDPENVLDLNIDVTQYDNVHQLKFLCNNGKNNDDSADWVIFSAVE